MSPVDMDHSIADKLQDSTWFLDGSTWQRVCALSKPVRQTIAKEKHVLSVDNPKFIHGQGVMAIA